MRRVALTLGLVVSACTGSIGSTGGDDDGNPPPPPPPPPPSTSVQIVVQDGAMPAAGVRVVFQNADGSQTTSTTDATGMAKADMPAGGNLSVIRPGVQPPQLDTVFTYVGVKGG